MAKKPHLPPTHPGSVPREAASHRKEVIDSGTVHVHTERGGRGETGGDLGESCAFFPLRIAFEKRGIVWMPKCGYGTRKKT